MSSSKRVIDLSLEEFCATVSSKKSTPAGGSTAASVGAQGVALAAMVIWLSSADLEDEARGYLEGSAEELEDLGECLLELVDRDAQAYRALCKGQGNGLGGEELGELAQAALDAPAEVAELCLIALRRLYLSREEIKEQLKADYGVALATLRAAIEGGLAVAEVNLPGLKDSAREADCRAALDATRLGLLDIIVQIESK